MALPRVIEYILTLGDKPKEGELVLGTATQLVGISTPLLRTAVQVLPTTTDYAHILYLTVWDDRVVPDVFQLTVQYHGIQTYSGLLTSGTYTLDLFVVITQRKPVSFVFQNLTALNQFFSVTYFTLSVPTEEAWDIVDNAITRLMSSTKDEELLNEAVSLLRAMSQGRYG